MREQKMIEMLARRRISRALLSTAIVAGCAGILAMTATPSAHAAPSLCSAATPHADGLSVDDVKLGGASADDCYGVFEPTGQPTASDANAGFGTLYHDNGGSDPFTKLFGIDQQGIEVGSDLDGFSFSLTDVNYATTGTFTLKWEGGVVPPTVFFDLVIGTKGAQEAALYLFDDFAIDATPGSSSGEYSIALQTPNGNNTPDLSNLTLFGRTGSPDGGITEISQPSTLMLLGGAFLLIGWAAQRGRREQV